MLEGLNHALSPDNNGDHDELNDVGSNASDPIGMEWCDLAPIVVGRGCAPLVVARPLLESMAIAAAKYVLGAYVLIHDGSCAGFSALVRRAIVEAGRARGRTLVLTGGPCGQLAQAGAVRARDGGRGPDRKLQRAHCGAAKPAGDGLWPVSAEQGDVGAAENANLCPLVEVEVVRGVREHDRILDLLRRKASAWGNPL